MCLWYITAGDEQCRQGQHFQGVGPGGFHSCPEVWEDQDDSHKRGSGLLLPRASAEQVRRFFGEDCFHFTMTHERTAVCDSDGMGMKCSMCCVRKPSKDPRDKTFPQPTNALEVYQQIQDTGKQTNTLEIPSKSCSVRVGQIQAGQVQLGLWGNEVDKESGSQLQWPAVIKCNYTSVIGKANGRQ